MTNGCYLCSWSDTSSLYAVVPVPSATANVMNFSWIPLANLKSLPQTYLQQSLIHAPIFPGSLSSTV